MIQFVPCIAIPLMAILLPPMYTHSSYWLWAAGFAFHLTSTSLTFLAVLWFLCITHSEFNLMIAVFYLLAKVEEAADKPIYRWTHHVVSGHTLKHLFAAMVPVFLTLMLAKRSIETQRYFVFSCCDLMNWFLLPQNFNVAFE